MNAVEIEEAVSALIEQPFDQAGFPYEFLESFGNKKATIDKLKKGDTNKSDIERGVLQRNNIHMAVCTRGNVTQTLNALRQSPATRRHKAKFLLSTDGLEIEAEDIISGDTISCEYTDFPNKFAFFLPMVGITAIKQIKENSFDIRATSRLNRLYVELLKDNQDWATNERRSDMNHFMARLIFCFFAEDTDIFRGENLFTETINSMSDSNSSNTHEVIGELFRSMDTPIQKRSLAAIRTWANAFPYVNGGLFSGSNDAPKFSRIARKYLLHIGTLDWRQINPDIFGSMIQAVADDEERGALGMHYTSVPNILKVLNPLFLDNLREQLAAAGDSPQKLLNLRKRLAKIRIFDPACGSGNFLVIAYKEMRAIESEINKLRGEVNNRSVIPLTNFRGIELRDFSAEVARLALIIAEYQCDFLYRGQKEALAEFLPLDTQSWITSGNALRLDWLSICPPTGKTAKILGSDLFSAPFDQAEIDFQNEGGEIFICGNPPYNGGKLQSNEQKDDLNTAFKNTTINWKSLDYVTGWFIKTAEFIKATSACGALVSTNSVCQGQQVPILWPEMFRLGVKISFAHESFKWSNLASRNAGVTVIIVGLCDTSTQIIPKLYSTDENMENKIREVSNINPYLIPATNLIIKPSKQPKNGLDHMVFGNMPRDEGHLLLSSNDMQELVSFEPSAAKFIRRYSGSEDFIHNKQRYCFWISEHQKKQASELKSINTRLNAVRAARQQMKASSTQKFADRPHRFVQIQGVAKTHSIIVPCVSSENRSYFPVGLLNKDYIISNSAQAIYDSPIWNLAILVSKLHLSWIALVCGKLETRYRYSNTLGWNTFPVPKLTEKNKEDLRRCAEDILIARETHFPATIADLYKPEDMPQNLRDAHDRNDEVLERIYIGRHFKNDTERVEKLFELYSKMIKGDDLSTNSKRLT